MKKYFVTLTILILFFMPGVLMMPLTAEGAGINEIQKKLKSDGISSQNSQSINQSISLKKSKNSNAKKQQKSSLKSSDEKNKQSACSSSIFNIKENDFKKTLNVLMSSIKADNQKNSKRISQRVAEPVRISEPSPNETQETKKDYLEVTPLSAYDKYFMPTSDSLEIEARGYVAFFLNNAIYFSPYGDLFGAADRLDQLTKLMPQFCINYSKYPYLCAIMKLFYSELMANYNGYPESVYSPDKITSSGYEDIKRFDQIYNEYNNNNKYGGVNNEIFKEVTQKSKEKHDLYPAKFEQIQVKIDELLKQIKESTEIFEALSQNKGEIEQIFINNEIYYRIDGKNYKYPDTSVVDGYYRQIIRYYGSMKKIDECEKYYNEFKKYFFEMPANFSAKYVQLKDNGEIYSVSTQTIQVTRWPLNYFEVSREYLEWLGRYGEIAEDGDIIYDKAQKLIKEVQSYKLDHDKDISSVTQANIDEEKKDFTTRYLGKNDDYYLTKPKITFMMFFKGDAGLISSNEVIDNKETITLRAEAKDQFSPLYPVKNVKIKSEVSNVEISLNLKRDFVLGDYYCSFVPADTKDESGNTFIKKIEEPSIAIAVCEKKDDIDNIETFDDIYKNIFFSRQMGYAAYRGSVKEHIDNKTINFEITQSFLKSGGMEKIICQYGEIIQETYIKNQAKWFLIYGHGNIKTGSIGESNSLINPAIANPSQLKYESYNEKYSLEYNEDGLIGLEEASRPAILEIKYDVGNLIKDKEISEYSDNMDLLILAACDCLGTPNNVKRWGKVLSGKDKLVLGYTGHVNATAVYIVLKEINSKLKNKISLDEIIKLWQSENELRYQKWPKKTWGYFSAKTNYWAYIYDDMFNYGHRCESTGFLGWNLGNVITASFKIEDIDELFEGTMNERFEE